MRIPADLSLDGLAAALALDKKAVASGLRLVLLTDIGRAVVDDRSTEEAIMAAMNHCRETT